MKYKCKYCGEFKEISEFGGKYRANVSACLSCKDVTRQNTLDRYRKRAKEYRTNNKDFIREISRKYHAKLRNKFFEMYGNFCVCCGETYKEFLTLEHIHGQRGNKKKDSSFRSYLIATKEYRPDLYEVLCWNCNCAKGKYGYCPHKTHIHG